MNRIKQKSFADRRRPAQFRYPSFPTASRAVAGRFAVRFAFAGRASSRTRCGSPPSDDGAPVTARHPAHAFAPLPEAGPWERRGTVVKKFDASALPKKSSRRFAFHDNRLYAGGLHGLAFDHVHQQAHGTLAPQLKLLRHGGQRDSRQLAEGGVVDPDHAHVFGDAYSGGEQGVDAAHGFMVGLRHDPVEGGSRGQKRRSSNSCFWLLTPWAVAAVETIPRLPARRGVLAAFPCFFPNAAGTPRLQKCHLIFRRGQEV